MSLTHVENRARNVPGTAELRSRHRSTIPSIDTFLQSLAELPLNAWLEIGQSIARERPHPTARDLALEHLRAAIRDHALEIVAWYVRDAIQTSAFLVTRAARRWTREERAHLTAARTAAETAALALLARPHLPREQFVVLYKSFAGPRYCASPNVDN